MKREPLSLVEALYRTIHRHPTLSVQAIAEEIGMSVSYLYRAVTPDAEINGDSASGVNFPLKRLIPLIRATGDYQVLDYIERQLGRIALPLPPVSATIADVRDQCMHATGEFGRLMEHTAQSLADGKVTVEELEAVEQAAYVAMQAIMRFVTAMGRVEGD